MDLPRSCMDYVLNYGNELLNTQMHTLGPSCPAPFETAANFGVADSKRVSEGTCVYSVFLLCGLHAHHLKHISVRNYRPMGGQRMLCGAALRGSVFHHNRYRLHFYFSLSLILVLYLSIN